MYLLPRTTTRQRERKTTYSHAPQLDNACTYRFPPPRETFNWCSCTPSTTTEHFQLLIHSPTTAPTTDAFPGGNALSPDSARP